MRITNDPYADADARDQEYRDYLETLPRCGQCGTHIEQIDAVYLEGKYYCDDCLENARKSIGDE